MRLEYKINNEKENRLISVLKHVFMAQRKLDEISQHSLLCGAN